MHEIATKPCGSCKNPFGERSIVQKLVVQQRAGERYDSFAALALSRLQRDGWLDVVTQHGPAFEVKMQPMRRNLARLRWHIERPFCKLLALVRLMKNATTFGDWVPYILWKIERHGGAHVEPTERQLRHPFIFGWPVLMRLLWRRDIR